MKPPMQPCERCGGSGCLPRLQRRRVDGSLDPTDIVGRYHESCDRCGGSGEQLADAPSRLQGRRGYAADLM